MRVACLFLVTALGAVLLPAQSSQGTTLGAHWEVVPRLQRQRSAMAYDVSRRVVVRFGGGLAHQDKAPSFLNRNSTWEWDGREWRACKPLHSPSARSNHGMAYDPISKRVILFGGGDGQRIFGDTWAWDGQDWKELKPLTSPKPRLAPAMGTDPGRRALYLFGGGLGYTSLGSGFQPQADTWRWTGSNWMLLKPKTSPPARGIALGQGGFFYCPKSKRMVMLGGMTSIWGRPPYETWEWDGQNWYQHKPVPSFGVSGPGMPFWKTGEAALLGYTYDTQKKHGLWHLAFWNGRTWTDSKVPPPTGLGMLSAANVDHQGEIVVTGAPFRWPFSIDQLDVQTWTFDGTKWKQRGIVETRFGHGGFVHDEARDQTLMLTWPLGGTKTSGLEIRRLGKNGNFEKIAVTGAPTIRSGYASVYHPGLRKLWLAGGYVSGRPTTYYRDCWTFDGSKWEQVNSKNAPFITEGAWSSVYDGARGRVVASQRDGSFMAWDLKTGWSKLPAVRLPPARVAGALAYDAARQRIVLFGGYGSKNLNDTWEYDGKTWTEIKTKLSPAARSSHHMHYVPALGGIVMFGGDAPHRDTWLFDGKDWKKLAVEEYKAYYYPGAGKVVESTYVVSRQEILAVIPPGTGVEMLWKFQVRTLTASQPYPRPGESLSLNALLPGQAQRPILFLLAGSDRPGIPLRQVAGLGTELLPLAPDALFMASLSLGLVNVLDVKGRASLPLRIPKLPSLIGVSFHAAALTLDLRGGIGAITNGVPLRIVR